MPKLLVLIACLVVIGCGDPATPSVPMTSTPETAVSAYLDALERGDGAAIAGMVGPRVDASAEIAELLATYRGLRLHDVTTTWLDDFEGRYVVAMVTGTADDSTTHRLRVDLVREGERYVLALGEAPLDGPVSDPSSPVP